MYIYTHIFEMKTHFFKTKNIFHFYRCFLNTKQKILTHDQKLK